MNRREMIKTGIGATALTMLGGIPLEAGNKRDKRKILVFGAHPDDPETGAGGTICLLAQAGHDVTVVYLTRGQASSSFTSREVAAAPAPGKQRPPAQSWASVPSSWTRWTEAPR